MQKKESSMILLILMTSAISIGLLLGNGKFALAEDKNLPPGISKKEQIPGKGSHKGWEQGKHKGWDKDKNLDLDKIQDKDKDKDKDKGRNKDKNKSEEGFEKKLKKDKAGESKDTKKLNQIRGKQRINNTHGTRGGKGK